MWVKCVNASENWYDSRLDKIEESESESNNRKLTWEKSKSKKVKDQVKWSQGRKRQKEDGNCKCETYCDNIMISKLRQTFYRTMINKVITL